MYQKNETGSSPIWCMIGVLVAVAVLTFEYVYAIIKYME